MPAFFLKFLLVKHLETTALPRIVYLIYLTDIRSTDEYTRIQILPVQVKLVKQPINNILKLSIEAMDW